jgi:opacity protein-like surface antigen
MGTLKSLLLAGAAACASLPALAADLAPPYMPRPAIMAPAAEEFSGWYLRGDVGVGSQKFSDFAHSSTNSAFVWPASWRIDQKGIQDTVFVGAGIGYQWNNWLRFDVTGEYRTDSKVKALGSYTEFCPGGRCFDLYDMNHQSWVFLANAYVDLGTWWCLTPFVGAGVGFGRHNVTTATDVGFISDGTTGFGFAAADKAEYKFAWAVHAGLAYNVSNNLKLELAYRYLNMGDVNSAVIGCNAGGCNGAGARAFYTLTDFTSHDFKLGMRWLFNEPVAAPPPLVRKG